MNFFFSTFSSQTQTGFPKDEEETRRLDFLRLEALLIIVYISQCIPQTRLPAGSFLSSQLKYEVYHSQLYLHNKQMLEGFPKSHQVATLLRYWLHRQYGYLFFSLNPISFFVTF